MTILWKTGVIFREFVTNAQNHLFAFCFLFKYGFIPRNNKILLIPDRPICETYV